MHDNNTEYSIPVLGAPMNYDTHTRSYWTFISMHAVCDTVYVSKITAYLLYPVEAADFPGQNDHNTDPMLVQETSPTGLTNGKPKH